MPDQPTSEISFSMKMDELRSDLKAGLVWFLNYAALDPAAVKSSHLDLHGSAMLPEDVQKFAHRWLAYSRSIDIEHDGIGRPITVIESFFNSEEVQAAAWPINSHAVRLDVSSSDDALTGLRSGALNSVSLDALTFNRMRRLPVDVAVKAAPQPWIEPASAGAWALELASMGYSGVTTVRRTAKGLYVCEREQGLPLAVHVTEDYVDVTAAGGAWGQISAVLCESGTLTADNIPDFDLETGTQVVSHTTKLFVVDHAPSPYQSAKDALDAAFYTTEVSPFVAILPSGGLLPHHVMQGGQEMVNLDAVRKALNNIEVVPEQYREAARSHLKAHLREAT
jgi:hypothetical protein